MESESKLSFFLKNNSFKVHLGEENQDIENLFQFLIVIILTE